MIALLRSEVLKARSTRTTIGLVLGMVVLIAFVTLATGFAENEVSLSQHDNQHNMFSVGSASTLFAALIGVMLMTSEYRHGTIRPTLLVAPRRMDVVAAKAIGGALVGIALGAFAQAVAFLLGWIPFAIRGIDFALDSGDVWGLVAASVLASALWGALGAGLGAVLRSQVGAIVGLLIWLLFVEHILFAVWSKGGKFAPGQATAALGASNSDNLLSPVAGGLVLAGWALAFAAAGALLTERRDVP